MRFIVFLNVLVVLIGVVLPQSGRHSPFNIGVRSRTNQQGTRLGLLASDLGVQPVPNSGPNFNSNVPVAVNSPTPVGQRGCFCLPPNQVCDPKGAIPHGSTRITNINTRIVNVDPDSNCPQEQIECCFGTFVGDGNVLPPVIPSPLTGCGGRNIFFQGRSGTDEADFGEYPWMAAIVDSRDSSFVSSGVLIAPQWVLTVAHKFMQPGTLTVRVGDYDLAVRNEVPQLPHQELRITQVIIHPGFKPTSLVNDVALLRLEKPVQAAQHINVACLPERFQRFSGQRCFVSGWGENAHGNFQAILKEVDLPIVDEFECEASLRRTRLGNAFILDKNSFLCAGGEAGKDACGGDGGAPLVCDEGGVSTVVGLVAWGIGCGRNNVPGVYVNVASFSEFINQNIYN